MTEFLVVYGIGGKTNTVWKRTAGVYHTIGAANEIVNGLVKQGFPAYAQAKNFVEKMGLPEGPAPNWDYANLCWKPRTKRKANS